MAQPAARHAAREHGRAPDVTGAVVLGCCAGWALICAAGRTARPEGVLLAVLAVTAGYACGRIAGSLLPVASATAVALAGAGLAFAGHGGGTAGHEGVEAAQLALATGAACCAAWETRSAPLRPLLWLLALVITVAALVAGSAPGRVVGGVAGVGVLLCASAAVRVRHRLPALACLALVTAVAVGGSWAVAEDTLPSGLSAAVQGQLTEHRVLLWRDAVRVAGDHPVRGAGPDLFGEVSPTASQEADSDGTPHSAPLQQAAGQGLPGVALLGAAYLWMLYALWRSPRSTAVVVTAGAALTAVAVEACMGNALSFQQVTAGAGLLAGLATARRTSGEPAPYEERAPYPDEPGPRAGGSRRSGTVLRGGPDGRRS